MATHDYVIANQSGAATRQDINNALAAIVSNNSSANAPATTYAFQFWFDTTNNILKIRNAANSAWIDWITTTATVLLPDGAVGTPSLTFASETDTGLYRIAANTLGIATSGTERVEISDTGIIINEGGAAAIDVRIEGDSDANLVFIDAGNDRVGIGTSSPSESLTLRGEQFIETNSTSADSGNGIYWQSTTSGWSSSSAHAAIYGKRVDGNNGYLRFDTRSSGTTAEQMRLDSSGRLLVGTTTAFGGNNEMLQVARNGGGAIALLRNDTSVSADNELGAISWYGNDSTSTTHQECATIRAFADADHADNDKPTRLVFSTCADGASTPTERLRITNDGTLQLRNSPGIDFSQVQTNAAGMTSETLDSYEEGTFTPAFAGASSAGTYTYATRTGHYTKIGDMVNVTVKLTNINTDTAGTGNVNITGLPFTSANNSSFVCGSVVLDQFNTLASTVSVSVRIDPNTAVLEILGTRDDLTDYGLDVTHKSSNSADIFCTITYRV